MGDPSPEYRHCISSYSLVISCRYLNNGEFRLLATYLSNPVNPSDLNEMFWHAVDANMIAADKDLVS